MKKKFIALLSLVLCLALCISLAACSNDKHEAKTEWTSDEANHWHECATEGHTDKLDEAAHAWDAGKVAADPTETANGVKTYECTVCGKTKTESMPKLEHTHKFATDWSSDATNHWHAATCGHDVKQNEAAHTWDEGKVTTAPTEAADGVKTYACTICGKTKTESIPKLEHTHDYDPENINFDATNHWIECSCGAKEYVEPHTFGDWSEKTPAGVDQNKQYSKKCKDCPYEDVLTFDNTKTNGTYCLAITEVIVMTDGKYIQAKVLRGTVEEGDNIVIDGLLGTFTADVIYRTDSKVQLKSASYGQSVSIKLGTESGDISKVDNKTACGRLAYEPDKAKVYTTFTALIKIDKSNYSGPMYAGKPVELDLYNVGYGLISCNFVLPEGVEIAQDNVSYVVTITLPEDASRALWAGMEFTYKLKVTDGSKVVVANGIVLSVAN